jgi:hypothetical protein
MNLKEILSISGRPGLYKMVSQSKNSIIVESLQDGKRFPVFASNDISSLEEISIYTETADVSLKEIFQKMFKHHDGAKAIDVKKSSAEDLKDYFLEIVPEYDEDRVYVSHIKKIISWYNELLSKDMMDLEADESEENTASKEKKQDNESKED